MLPQAYNYFFLNILLYLIVGRVVIFASQPLAFFHLFSFGVKSEIFLSEALHKLGRSQPFLVAPSRL